jgi:hypothetical protein
LLRAGIENERERGVEARMGGERGARGMLGRVGCGPSQQPTARSRLPLTKFKS